MNFSKLVAPGLIAAALTFPVAGFSQDANPGEFKVPGTETTLTLNGFVEIDTTYDFHGADEDIRGDDWATFIEFQPLDKSENQLPRFYLTARTSRLGVSSNTPTPMGPLAVRIEGDFNSPSPFNYSTEATTNGTTFRLRHAYGELHGLLIGQTWSNFMDLGSLPDTVDFNPHGAFALTRQPMIRYTFGFGGSTLAVSAENPQSLVLNTEATPSLTVGRRYDRFPDVIASLTIPFSIGHINVRGVALEYNGQRADNGVMASRWGWGAGLSGSLKFGPETLVWSAQGGDGIGRYMFQSLFQGGAFVGDQIELWRTVSYHVGLTHTWSPALRSNVAWTQTFFAPNDPLAAVFGSIANRRVDVLFVNTFFKPIKSFDIGLEYSYGKRTLFSSVAAAADALEGTQHRVNALLRYTFF